jgi:hypothetical protein
MLPVVDRLSDRGYPVQKVDFDRHRELARKFGVTQLPTFVMVVNGRAVDREVGATSYARLEQMCRQGEAARLRSIAKAVPIPRTKATNPLQHSRSTDDLLQTVSQAEPAQSSGAAGLAAANDLEARLLAATVRLRIDDGSGHNCGTGTIIDARQGQALILTCGHIFRDSKGRGRIAVDLFGPTPAQGIRGNVLSYDLESDIGLVWIETPGQVTAVRVAPLGYQPRSGDRVVSTGCNNGDVPTVQRTQITAIDRYAGPPNLVVAGQPVEGRSGGGLFSVDRMVIGVCNARDPDYNEGLFAALGAIQAELDRSKLSHLYRSPSPRAEGQLLASTDLPAMPREMPGAARSAPQTPSSNLVEVTSHNAQASLRPEEQAALDEIRRRQQEGAEVVCIIRSRANPEAKSEVLVLDRVTPAFVEQLAVNRPPLVETQQAISPPERIPTERRW